MICKALLAGIFALISLFNRAKHPPQLQWRIRFGDRSATTHRAET
jgi:hypothetical protein